MIYNIISIYISIYFLICGVYFLYSYLHKKKNINLLLGIISLIMCISLYKNNIYLPIYLEIPFFMVFVAGTLIMIVNINKLVFNKNVD